MLRPDSFTITFNLPPEIIREYYDGLAKVETAKNSKPSSKSNLSSILNSCKPMLSKFCDTAEAINPKIAIGVGLDDETFKDFYKNIKSLNDLLKDETTVSSKVECKSSTPQPSSQAEYTPATPATTETTPATQAEYTPATTETTPQSSSKKQIETKKPKDKKIKKPYYQDGDNVVVDLNSIASVFGENANGGNIGDMMKMFAPMMEGLMGNLNQQKQNGDNKQTTENKPTENKETTDIK
jgi:hypothetical protein